ncbi:MAG: DUF3378 domain-containing protein [archaeon]|nr:DUF3378 domain-containing protein [archaeon]
MQETLNFGKTEITKIKEILSSHEQGKTTNYFEEMRTKYLGCTITLYSSGKVSIQGVDASKVKDEILAKMGLVQDLTIGIDETGRGESDGPLVITGVLCDNNELRQVRDSKKTSDIAKKEKIVSEKMLGSVTVVLNARLVDLVRNNGKNLNTLEAETIDKISEILRGYLPANTPAKTIVDGAPLKVKNADIIFLPKADDNVAAVGAASIVAKHTRNNSSDKQERKTWKKKEN